MAPRNGRPDFESRYFDLINERSDKQDDKLEKILEQVRYTNGRVTKLEGQMADVQARENVVPAKKDLPAVLKDPKFIQICLYLSIALLLIVAYFTKVDVAGLLR